MEDKEFNVELINRIKNEIDKVFQRLVHKYVKDDAERIVGQEFIYSLVIAELMPKLYLGLVDSINMNTQAILSLDDKIFKMMMKEEE